MQALELTDWKTWSSSRFLRYLVIILRTCRTLQFCQLLPVGEDTEPDKDIKDDSIKEDDTDCDGDGMGNTKVDAKDDHKADPHNEIQGKHNHHWNEEASFLTPHSINEATSGDNHPKTEDGIRNR